jgi:DNA end-binding protein Ku
MRPIWKGSLTFGLVNIPVELHSAVRPDDRISFRQLHEADLSPIRYRRVCENEGDEVPWSEIVKGYEYAKGRFVVVTEEDFKSAGLESSRSFEILDFVRAEEIDARYFETPYYLLPSKGGEKSYALLREAVRRSGMVGIGKLTMRANSHHLAGIKVVDDALVLEIMRFHREIVEVDGFTFPSADAVRPQELEMAERLVANLADTFEPEKYRDEYQENLRAIIRAKMKGKKVTFEEPEEPRGTAVIDLMARLQESLDRGRSGSARKRPARAAAKASSTARAASRGTGGTTARRPRARSRKSA